MKTIFILLVALLCTAALFAQEKGKNSYVKEGNLIKATLFHDNGEISQKGYYTEDGKLHGTWISYDANGSKTAVAQYENGSKTGKWFFWNGDMLREVDYSDSKITNVSTWKIAGERVVSNN